MKRAFLPLAAFATAAALTGCASDAEMSSSAGSGATTTSARYTCTDGFAFGVRFTTETQQVMTFKRTVPTTRTTATLLLQNAPSPILEGQPVGSGIHYAGQGYDLRGKGDAATLTSPDGKVRDCRAGA
ncbi:MliC family protein [Caulobacter sp. 17J80-11]|uniref:MliC family protein n=1 Tax=Caulobacter sp. 17J80-11 TaxID=2763502 RepID=UPI0016535DA2|nr:MliC family protein [Caulobacter sp. 17J80-11]MBC6983676.1 MliC family protein [Caulobacter sp. 17J80-11]